jgi:outer membrane protein TolC
VQQHLHNAQRFESAGVLSKVERMHAQVAFDEARRNLTKARADFAIANVSLQKLLRSKQSLELKTALFVLTQPLAPLAEYLDNGLASHSQIAILEAKHSQAQQGAEAEKARFKPSITAFGAYNYTSDQADFSDPLPLLEPDWIVGIGIRFPLFDRYNRSSLVSAAQARVQRVTALQQELAVGLSAQIEQSYLAVERAREQFLLLDSSIELAIETLRLRKQLFKEGLGTSLDVIDAQLAVARAETERAGAAYDFVLSLVDLLEASGQLRRFDEFINRADVRLISQEKKYES